MSEQIEVGADYHLRKVGRLYRAATGERDRLKAELAKLQAEREPRDNGDGTVTAMLPVTYPKGLPVECVRSLREGDRYVECDGDVFDCQNSDDETSPGQMWLILRPAPQPPVSVTWEAPLVDGVWHAQDATFSTDDGQCVFTWWGTGEKIRGINRPIKYGKYLFANGVGTLIEESK